MRHYISSLTLAFLLLNSVSTFSQVNSIKIGLLVPDQTNSEVVLAAELAMSRVNSMGGFNGIPFELAIRTTEGSWGAGSKESVSMVYEDSVWAILGSLNGRNAHLVEQVAAKSHILYLETRATEATLSQAYVPWFFRCVPNDDQQAIEIYKDIGHTNGRNLAIICTDTYDSNMAAKSFVRISDRLGLDEPEIFIPDPTKPSFNQLMDLIKKKSIRQLVITDQFSGFQEVLGQIKEQLPLLKVYGTHTITSQIALNPDNWKAYGDMRLISAASLLTPLGKQFQTDFTSRFGLVPGINALFMYDGTSIILEAIIQSGLDKEAVKEYVEGLSYPGGVTGSIAFDSHGNRIDWLSD